MLTTWRPVRTLLAIAFAGLLTCLVAIGFVTQQPWLGLELAADKEAGLRITTVAPNGPASALQGAQRLMQVAAPDGSSAVDLQAMDLTGDPDEIIEYAQVDTFIARQSQLVDVLRQRTVQLTWLDASGTPQQAVVEPRHRPLADLPFLFWFELVCALGGLLISGWVLALRAGNSAARFFALTGLCMFIAILVQSLYANRELALPYLRLLDAINHGAVFAFGCALINLFLCYPQPMVARKHLLWPWLLYLPLWLLDTLRLMPDQNWGVILPLIGFLLTATVLSALRWRQTRHQPLQRASLRWFVLSFMVACWLFVFTTIGPIALGYPPLFAVGYAAGFLLLIYVGLALGITRYRLFELNIWAYRIVLTVLGAVLVAVLDLALIWALHLDSLFSLGWALFLSGWLYFPLRQWVWQRLAGRPGTRVEELLPDVISIAFNASAEGREQQWQQLLQRLFAPLEIQGHSATLTQAGVAAEGLGLLVPAVAGMQARSLRYANQGARLFTTLDAVFANGLCDLMRHAAASRDAYDRGAAEERGRVYRDLHDDIGAKLLSLAIGAETPARADLARSALNDLRDVVSHSGRGPMPLSALVADWRSEMDTRLRAAGLELEWTQPLDVPDDAVAPGVALHLGRILREATSNVLRHAQAQRLQVNIDCQHGSLTLRLRDDGRGFNGQPERPGKGLVNMRMRAELLGATIAWQDAAPQGCEVTLTVALALLAQALEDAQAPHSGGTQNAPESLA